MNKQLAILGSLVILAPAALFGCSQGETPQAQTSPSPSTAVEKPQATTAVSANSPKPNGPTGILVVNANGQDLVRKGVVSKDGWKISFDNLFVNLAQVTAYQTESPFNPEAGGEMKAKEKVVLVEDRVIDLAEGDEAATPILVTEGPAPAGPYNALSWKMIRGGAEGPVIGQSMVMVGTATKDGKSIPFNLKINEELTFTCGAFVGKEPKGVLKAGNKADLEMTFNFAHLFGDAKAPANDKMNQDALGFEPLAAAAEGGKLDIDMAKLKQKLSAKDYEKFQKLFLNIGHTGEGHCKGSMLSGEKQS